MCSFKGHQRVVLIIKWSTQYTYNKLDASNALCQDKVTLHTAQYVSYIHWVSTRRSDQQTVTVSLSRPGKFSSCFCSLEASNWHVFVVDKVLFLLAGRTSSSCPEYMLLSAMWRRGTCSECRSFDYLQGQRQTVRDIYFTRPKHQSLYEISAGKIFPSQGLIWDDFNYSFPEATRCTMISHTTFNLPLPTFQK